MNLYYIELTDTFGGEANYSWVTRHVIRASTVRGAITKLAKRSGLHFKCVSNYGDCLRYDSRSGATCAFVSAFDADSTHHYYTFSTDDRESN